MTGKLENFVTSKIEEAIEKRFSKVHITVVEGKIVDIEVDAKVDRKEIAEAYK